jgi:hypothetical protein
MMKAFKVISVILYLFIVFITASLALRFVTAKEYFSYHAQAAEISWSAVDPGLQVVYLAVFKVCGAALLAVCVGVLFMIVIPFAKNSHKWSYYAIPMVCMLFWSITLATTWHVTTTTPATAPWGGSLFCVVMILVAFVSSLLGGLKSSKGNAAAEVEH